MKQKLILVAMISVIMAMLNGQVSCEKKDKNGEKMDATKQIRINRLSKSNSPYLLQHQNNPVDWHEWGEEAFRVARRKNQLIFLSIGYSTCHWCHVMAHESFEDHQVAELLNENYVSIKVDREERPDIDKIYMDVCQAMTGGGGWPLTIVMTPEKLPIFAGTYFPKESKYGRPGLVEILKQISAKWKSDQPSLLSQAKKIGEHFAQSQIPEASKLVAQILNSSAKNIERSYDSKFAGFSAAPKFPMGHVLVFLAREAARSKDQALLEKVEKTMLAMYRGGIFDQVGFGFCRYSVDAEWLIPHFEKMLYDNALIAKAALELFQISKKPVYGKIVASIFAYVLRDLTSAQGGFYSAENADSEGVEGKFYVFTAEEFSKVVGDGSNLLKEYFGVTEKRNFEHLTNNLHVPVAIEEFCQKNQLVLPEFAEKVEAARIKLFVYRSKRVRPSLDDKILTAWNGLMIGVMADAGRVLGEPSYIDSARSAADFILENLREPDGTLLRSWRQGKASIGGFLEDYSYFCGGLISLYQADHDIRWLREAVFLHDYALKNFPGKESGVFYETAASAEKLFVRPLNQYDGAMPSAVSELAMNSVRLGRITGREEMVKVAEEILERNALFVKRAPSGFARHLSVLDLLVNGGFDFVVAADSTKESTPFFNLINSLWLPGSSLIFLPTGKNREEVEAQIPFVKEMKPERTPVVFLCRGFSCLPPIYNIDELKRVLKSSK